jgi:hypothetical protein
MPRLGTGGIRQGGAVAFPGRAHMRAEKLDRGRHGRRSEVDRRATPASLPQCKMGHGPLPCSRMDKRCARAGKARRMAGSSTATRQADRQARAAKAQGAARRAQGACAQPLGGGLSHQGEQLCAREEPPEDLSARQRERLLELKRAEGHLARAWTLKEDLESCLPRKGCA